MEGLQKAKTSTDLADEQGGWLGCLGKGTVSMYQQRKSLPNAPRADYSESSPSQTSPVKTPETSEATSRRVEELQVYRQLFEDIIKQDNVYGSLLTTVKAKYDKYVDSLEPQKPELTSRLEQVKQEVNSLREAIALEKKQQAETLNHLFKELRKSKARETQYVELMRECQQKGYPVQSLYQTHIRKTRNKASEEPPL